jgi:hypothetical protein
MVTHFAAKGEVVTGPWRDKISDVCVAGAALRRIARSLCVECMTKVAAVFIISPHKVHPSIKMQAVRPSSLRGALATKQSSLVLLKSGLLRFARNDEGTGATATRWLGRP